MENAKDLQLQLEFIISLSLEKEWNSKSVLRESGASRLKLISKSQLIAWKHPDNVRALNSELKDSEDTKE